MTGKRKLGPCLFAWRIDTVIRANRWTKKQAAQHFQCDESNLYTIRYGPTVTIRVRLIKRLLKLEGAYAAKIATYVKRFDPVALLCPHPRNRHPRGRKAVEKAMEALLDVQAPRRRRVGRPRKIPWANLL